MRRPDIPTHVVKIVHNAHQGLSKRDMASNLNSSQFYIEKVKRRSFTSKLCGAPKQWFTLTYGVSTSECCSGHTTQPQASQAATARRTEEHCMADITSASNMCRLEGIVKEVDEKYFKNKPTCNICGKVFSEASSLRRHMRIHKGVKPYVCHLCGKAFTQCNQLKTHVRTHTEHLYHRSSNIQWEKSHISASLRCDKGFAQKCQLVFHSRMHHGEEKPYKCDMCNLQFATSSNLKIHVRKHSGEKPYVCDRCGQRFAQASTLTYHVRRHTGEKPYVCDTCGKAFAVSSSLITHARKHTVDRNGRIVLLVNRLFNYK
ncbi:unnamed protein product [Ranitomeya imitator]|uniref:C2H2-type domain-containing protein n=1 Tax=Ranitomeya imitator TaxID=111125 RepID=A0ABN9KVH0_9NEOB|nr:unnamed protein product [Ranitomeya imitator]